MNIVENDVNHHLINTPIDKYNVSSCAIKGYNLGGKVLERPPMVREVAGSISGRVKPNI